MLDCGETRRRWDKKPIDNRPELANDEEMAIAGAPGGTRQVGTAGAANGTAREMTSLHGQFADATAVDPGAVADIAALEAELLDLHRVVYELGGTPSYLITSPAYVHHINAMAFAAGRQRDVRNEKTLVNVVDQLVPLAA